ncbi:WxcM-like domain-containing protein [Sinomicrobium kalidii]|uniref:WxcM-like domain-containing protein n=1 Tax=Sinomicrobium kalidii TaxID=2900738 RepID=UPI001E5731B9|nr:WxcM-like domain-containing protein [Sinomicrobium kalidii]UGU14382.1 WxcM-like domain-containing protein [Sinomicrobium kalidii]
MELPVLIRGGHYEDERGQLEFNNDFDALPVKRIYTIKNIDSKFIRAWQGHKIERRWFSAINGAFEVKLIRVNDWESPSKNLQQQVFLLQGKEMDILSVPPGYISSIQALEDDSKLLVMADHALGEVKDEYRYDVDYFKD